jgi:hypothetical protein
MVVTVAVDHINDAPKSDENDSKIRVRVSIPSEIIEPAVLPCLAEPA